MQIRKKIISIFLTGALLIGSLPFAGEAKAEESGERQNICTIYDGENLDAQDYTRAASPIMSYLTVCSDNRRMRVQAGNDIDGILVEYYDDSYQFLSAKLIPEELPIFGGFYESEKYYFLLTGNVNPEESADVEVYRITKYDKDWNRLGSAGLSDCNTTTPFRAGSARMDTVSNYLVIRTCHAMYKSANDGLNHQANAMIQLDMESMQITDSHTIVKNIDYGYVSHSFNQFVKAESNRLVGVDHGDAYPRSIVLIKYPKDVSDGMFTPGRDQGCSAIDVLNIPGNQGENNTGASIGGFEISDSDYLIAGNSVVQDENNLQRDARNVFVAAVDKNTDAVTMRWITDYKDGEGTTSTPHLVKLDRNEYMILWSEEGTVYYTKVNGKGEQTEEIYQMSGNLSDCVPIVINQKLVWYTWYHTNIAFYEINLNDLSDHQITDIKRGHEFEIQNAAGSDGIVTLKCRRCDTIKAMQTITDLSVYWNETGEGTHYSSFNSTINTGDKLYYMVANIEPSNADNRELEVFVDNPKVLQWDKRTNERGCFTALEPGNAIVTFRPKYNLNVSKSFVITVSDKSDISGDDPGNNPGNNPGDDPGNNPGDDPGNNPGDNPGNNPGNDPGDDPGNTPGGNSGIEEPGSDDEENPAVNIIINGEENYDYAYQLLDLLNETRTKAGVSEVEMDAELLETAMKRAAETAILFSHTRPNGESCFTAFRPGGNKGENIAAGYRLPEGVMEVWTDSPDHYANMTEEEFTSVGVGCFTDSEGMKYWALCFDDQSANVSNRPETKEVVRTLSVLPSNLSLFTQDTYEIAYDSDESEWQMRIWNENAEYSVITPELSALNFNYFSDNPATARVNESGVITIEAPGTAVITAVLKADSSILVSLRITKMDKPVSENPTTVPQRKTPHKISGSTSYRITYDDQKGFDLNANSVTGARLQYSSNNTSVAEVDSFGYVSLTGIGQSIITITAPENERYTGTQLKVTVTVYPKTPYLYSVKSSVGKAKLNWNRSSKVAGYQIRYSKNKNMRSAKKKKISKAGKTTVTLKGLKKGKKYYFQIRAYKGSYYSEWSNKRSIKIKKKR